MQYEQKLGCQAPTCEAVTDQERPPSLEAQVPDAPSNTCAADKRLMNVDEIVEFINSGDAQKAEKASRKAAKRARQKQRKVNIFTLAVVKLRVFC
jgi:hypothetical protein